VGPVAARADAVITSPHGLRDDFAISIRSQRPVLNNLLLFFPAMIGLAIADLLVAILLGFRSRLWSHQILAIKAAKLIGRPARIVLSREGRVAYDRGPHTTEQRMALGAKADGTLAAPIHPGIAAMTTH
jgi:hypothetical protein